MTRWYAHVPKTPCANRQWRLDVLREAQGSAVCRHWLRDCCRQDVLFYVNGFSWTYDPRLPGRHKTVPFVTYAMQDRAILTINDSIEKGRDLVIEKSRDQGATWICASVFEWRWHFQADQTFLVISRDADEVDKPGYPDAIFAKLDIIHANVPNWLMPQGWTGRAGKNPNRKRMTFVNPETGSTINGEATVAAAGVGGRRTAILIDEFSRIDEGYALLAGTADVTPCRIFNFTPYGTGNASYEIAHRGAIRKLRMHWEADPRKNRKMYQWDGDAQRVKYFRFDDSTLKRVECEPHEYTQDDADTTNYGPDEGYPDGKPFDFVKDGVLRSPVYDIEDTRRANRQAMAMMWDIDYAGSEFVVFDKKLLMELDAEFCVPPYWQGDFVADEATGELLELVEDTKGPLKLWLTPNRTAFPPSEGDLGYAAGVDVSLGVGTTNSCLSVCDASTGQKVAEYTTPFEKPEKFAAKCVALLRCLKSPGGGEATLAWERIGPGETFGSIVLELGYSSVYLDGVESNPGVRRPSKVKPGWAPSAVKKDALLGEYQVALRQRRFINRSTLALQECEKFKRTPTGIEYVAPAGTFGSDAFGAKDPSGARENHGDRVIADALANRVMKSLGGGTARKLAQSKPDPENVVGSLAWRMKLHREKQSEIEELWG